MVDSLITFTHVGICVLLILIVLLQQGKGADMGATFGGGSNTLFGSSGADNLLTRVTTVIAMLFMSTSVLLAMGNQPGKEVRGTLFQDAPAVITVDEATPSEQKASSEEKEEESN